MSGLWATLAEPFAYGFFVRGLAAAVLAGALCGLLGVYVTLRGMSYIGHGLSHAVFGGYAAAPLLGVPAVLGAGIWGLGSALAIGAVTRRRGIGADAAIGVVTTASFALGVALLTRFGTTGPAFESLLFGSINGVAERDLALLAAVLAAVAAAVAVLHRPLLFSTFDPEVAQASGVPVARLDALLMGVLSLSLLATLGVLGVTLVAAALVIPAVVARMLSDSFGRILRLATVLGAAGGAVGMYASYHLEIPSGTTIVLTDAAVFLVVLALTGGRGLPRTRLRGRGRGRGRSVDARTAAGARPVAVGAP